MDGRRFDALVKHLATTPTRRRFLAALLNSVAAGLLGRRTLAQDSEAAAGVEGNTYTSPTWGYSLSWDPDVWGAVTSTSERGEDKLQLEAGGYVVNLRGGPGHLETCIDDALAEYEAAGERIDSGVEFYRFLPDRIERPDVVVMVFVGFETTSSTAEGIYLECRSLVPDEAVLLVTSNFGSFTFAEYVDVSDEQPRKLGNWLDKFEPLIATLELPDPQGIAEAQLGGDEEPAVEIAVENGIVGNTYTSPTWGYSLSWDEDRWSPVSDQEIVGQGSKRLDQLRLEDGTGVMVAKGYAGHNGDPESCLEGEVALQRDFEGVSDFELATDENDNSIRGTTPTGVAYEVHTLTFTDREANGDEFAYALYIECRTLVEGEAVLSAWVASPVDEFSAEMDAVLPVLDTIKLFELASSDGAGEMIDPHAEETPPATDGSEPTACRDLVESCDSDEECCSDYVCGVVVPEDGSVCLPPDWDACRGIGEACGEGRHGENLGSCCENLCCAGVPGLRSCESVSTFCRDV